MEHFDKNNYNIAFYVRNYLDLHNKHRLLHIIYTTIIGGGKN